MTMKIVCTQIYPKIVHFYTSLVFSISQKLDLQSTLCTCLQIFMEDMDYLSKGKLVQALSNPSFCVLHVVGVFGRSEQQAVLGLHIHTALNTTCQSQW